MTQVSDPNKPFISQAKGNIKIVTSEGTRLETAAPRLTPGIAALESLLYTALVWLAIDGRLGEVLDRSMKKLKAAGYHVEVK